MHDVEDSSSLRMTKGKCFTMKQNSELFDTKTIAFYLKTDQKRSKIDGF